MKKSHFIYGLPLHLQCRAGFVIFKIVSSMLQFVKASTFLSTKKFMVSQWSGDSLSGDRLPSPSLVIGGRNDIPDQGVT